MIERIEQLASQARAEVASARSTGELEQLRVRYLGRKAELPRLLRGVGELPASERGAVGKAANLARAELEALLQERARALEAQELTGELTEDVIDVTLPGAPAQPVGRLHLL